MSGKGAGDSDWVANLCCGDGRKEWEDRFRSSVDFVDLFVHTHYLRRFVRPGMRVLDLGPGTGCFTRILGEMGCRVIAAERSPASFRRHPNRALGIAETLDRRLRMGRGDTSPLSSRSFDAVVCYGDSPNHSFKGTGATLGECARFCRPGGYVLVSVLSLWGAVGMYLDGALGLPYLRDGEVGDGGSRRPESWSEVARRCRMFRARELLQLAEDVGLEVVVISASNALSLGWEGFLSHAGPHRQRRRELLRLELEACLDEGCLDMGIHIILVGRKG
jgi:SAM-dependent methyltransferase